MTRTAGAGAGRAIAIAAAAVLIVVVGVAVALGVSTYATGTNPGSIRAASDTTPQDPLSGAIILPVKNVSAIEAHCQGRNACWVWRIVAKRSCTGTVDIDFDAHAGDAAPVERSTEPLVVHANQPAYVSVPSTAFREHYAKVTQYDC